MPKNKKSAIGRSSSPEKKCQTETLSHENSKKHDDIFSYVQEMFNGKVDPDVVHMVLTECDWGVEEAIDTLFSFMGDGGKPQNDSSNKLFDLASSVLTGSNTTTTTSSTPRDKTLFTTDTTCTQNGQSDKSGISLLKRVNTRFVEGLVSGVVDQVCSNPQPVPNPATNQSLPVSQSITSELESTSQSQLSKSDLLVSSETLMVSNLLSIYGETKIQTVTPSGFIALMKQDSSKHVNRVGDLNSHDTNTWSSTAGSSTNQISLAEVLEDDATSQNMPYLNSLSHTGPQTSLTSSNAHKHSQDSNLTSGVMKGKPVSSTSVQSGGLVLHVSAESSCETVTAKSGNIQEETPVKTQCKTISKSAEMIHQSVTSKTHEKNQTNLSDPDIVSMTTDEKRVSPYILSPKAPEFIPMAKYSQVSNLTSPVFYTGVEAGGLGARDTQSVHSLSLINPNEMSTPGTYVHTKDSAIKKKWFTPSDPVLFSDIFRQSSKNAQPRPKQAPAKPISRNIQREIIDGYVKANKKVLVLLRGCPGSGKSTLARQIQFGGVILTTDDYFMRGNFYEYDQGLLGDAHQWNQQRSENSMKAGISPIVIDNTNTQKWEMKPYVIQAQRYKYNVELMEPQTKWKNRARELAKRNSHGVGLESIQRMLQRFDYKVTVEDIISSYRTLNKTQFIRPSADEVKKQPPVFSQVSSFDLAGKLLEKNSSECEISVDTNSESSDHVIVESVEEVDLCENNLIDEQSDKFVVLPTSKETNKMATCIMPESSKSSNTSDTQLSKTKHSVLSPTEILPLDIKPSNVHALIIDQPSIKQLSDVESSAKILDDSKTSTPYNRENNSIISYTNSAINSDTLFDLSAVESRQQKGSNLCGNSVEIVDLDNSILTDDSSNSFNNVEFDMLTDMKSKLKDIRTSMELENLTGEFDALLHITNLSDTRKNNLQSVVECLVKQVRERLVQPIDSVQTFTVSTSLNPPTCTSKLVKTSSPDLNCPLIYESASWDSTDPEPQCKSRGTSVRYTGDDHIKDFSSCAETSYCQDMNNAKTDLNQKNKNIDKSGENELSKQKKKMRKNVSRRPNSPLLRNREQYFLQNSWIIPSFEMASNPVVLPLNNSASKLNPVVETSIYCTQATNTSPRDFNVLHCVNDGYEANLTGTQFRLLIGQERDISPNSIICSPNTLSSNGFLDKSTTTEDLQMNEQDNLDFLQSCFSEVPVEELRDILSSCAQDVTWAVNILLDWGYDSIGEHPSRRKKIMLNRLRSSDGGDDEELGLHPVTKPEILPLTLVDLCSDSLKTSKSITEKKIEDLLIAGSEKRLEIVETMTMRVQRLLSSDNPISVLDEIWVKQGTQLCSYPDSENDSENTSDNVDSCEVSDSEEFDTEDLSADNDTTLTQECQSVTVEKLSASSDRVMSLVPTEESNDSVSEGEQSEKSVKLESSSEADNAGDSTRVKLDSTPEAYKTRGSARLELDSTPEVDDAGDSARIPVVLAADGIRTLLALFGPFSDVSEEGKEMRSCVVEVDYSMAKALHSCVKETLAKGLSKVISSKHNVKDCTNELSEEENGSKSEQSEDSSYQYKQSKLVYQNSNPFQQTKPVHQKKQRHKLASLKMQQGRKHIISKKSPGIVFGRSTPHRYGIQVPSRRQKSPLSFREIQEEELAKQLSKEEYMKLLEARGDTVAISTRLKRQKLQERFPGVDDGMLDEFFEANRFVLEDTSRSLQAVLGSESPQTVMTAEMAEKHENYLISLAKEKSLQEVSSPKKLPLITTVSVTPKYQSVETPDYMDFRAEAVTHHQLRQECFQKAQEAFRRGMKDVAVFYSRQGHLHTEKLREANDRASNKILEYRNADLEESSTIDLHGLHPNEAVHHLSYILQQRQQDLLRSPSNVSRQCLSVITGKGVHSRGGKAKVKPAVVEFLKRSTYSWSDVSSGVIRVILRS